MDSMNLKFVWVTNTPIVKHCLANPSLMLRINTQNTQRLNNHRCSMALGPSSDHIARSIHIETRTLVDLSPWLNGTVSHFIERIAVTEFIVVGCGVVGVANSVFGGGVFGGSVFDSGVFDGNVFDRSVFDSGLGFVISKVIGGGFICVRNVTVSVFGGFIQEVDIGG
jgi:hypothetical protein